MAEPTPERWRPDLFFKVVWIGFVLLGPVLGALLLPEAWSLFRRLGAGLLGGVGCAFILTANRMLGAYVGRE